MDKEEFYLLFKYFLKHRMPEEDYILKIECIRDHKSFNTIIRGLTKDNKVFEYSMSDRDERIDPSSLASDIIFGLHDIKTEGSLKFYQYKNVKEEHNE